MEITGTLVQVNEPITGQGKNGMWKKQEFIIETPGQYPKKVMITAWGDKINLAAIKPGSQVTVQILAARRRRRPRLIMGGAR
jgi:Domain of unknown function (DUF3127)